MADQPRAAAGEDPQPLWFIAVGSDEPQRRALTRQRVVAEALEVISADGVDALSMRSLAARLGVVPGALYRHLRSKEQLCDLVVDGVLAEIDTRAESDLAWAGQVRVLAQRLRTVLEDHPGIASLLKTRDPLGPHSLALAEALLAPLLAADIPAAQAALAFSLIYDYSLGFALSDRTTANERRVQDTATRHQLHAFFRSLPTDRFPALAVLGERVWADNRDERFSFGLDTLLAGLQTLRQPAKGQPPGARPDPLAPVPPSSPAPRRQP